jgi:hypothetical protein
MGDCFARKRLAMTWLNRYWSLFVGGFPNKPPTIFSFALSPPCDRWGCRLLSRLEPIRHSESAPIPLYAVAIARQPGDTAYPVVYFGEYLSHIGYTKKLISPPHQSAFVDSFPHSLTVCFPDRLESLSCVHRPPPIVHPAVREIRSLHSFIRSIFVDGLLPRQARKPVLCPSSTAYCPSRRPRDP